MINVNNLFGLYEVDKEMAALGTLVLSRRQVMAWKPDQDDLVLVSIRDQREEPLPKIITDSYDYVLELVFDDILESSPWLHRDVFSLDQAEKLWYFFKSHQGKPMIIHCHAGVSRSAAVAVCRAFFDRATKLLTKLFDDKFSPNPTVTRKFLEYAETREGRSLFMRWDKI